MQEAFRDNEDIFYVNDIAPETLANRIIEIKNNPGLCQKVGSTALKTYETTLSNKYAHNIIQNKIFNQIIKEELSFD